MKVRTTSMSLPVVLLGALALAEDCAANQTAVDPTTARLFDQALASRGRQYLKIRDELLERSDAVDFLRQVAQDDSRAEEVRWLAEIIRGRGRHQEEFQLLERSFCRKAAIPHPVALRKQAFGPGVFDFVDDPLYLNVDRETVRRTISTM